MKRLLILFILISLITAACSEDNETTDEEEKERIVAVTTEEVTKEDFVLERTIYGRTSPNQITPVTAQLPGEVKELIATNGEFIEEGDKIATLSTVRGNINITAPTDGQITGLEAKEDSVVSNEEPFALIADHETMILEFSVTANIQQILNMDDTFKTMIEGEDYEATITNIDSMPGETGLYPIKATIENPDYTILPGMIAEITVPEEVIENALTVPTAAVIHEDNENFVYVVENNTAKKRKITVLETGTETTAIEGDVKPGDEVITSGQLTLSDGDKVDVQKGE